MQSRTFWEGRGGDVVQGQVEEHRVEALVRAKPHVARVRDDLAHALGRHALEHLRGDVEDGHRRGERPVVREYPAVAHVAKDFIKSEQSGELTKPSLETLTIVAYRGPITKAELEQIRGVNCSLIIRNLLIRGLIVGDEEVGNGQIYYRVTVDFLKYLGLNFAAELPDYARLHSAENLESILNINEKSYVGDTADGGQA